MIDNCHRKNLARQNKTRFFYLLFNNVFVVDPYGIWTSLKRVLKPLNINRYRLLKLTVNNIHSPTIRQTLNVNGLLHK